MTQDSEGNCIARERIAAEAIARTGVLNLRNLQLSELPAELSCLHHLIELNCARTQVRDLSPLSDLIALQKLNCAGTRVSDLSPLSGLTAMKWLACDETQVRDLSPLSGLTALQELACAGTEVSDLSPLSGLTALQKLASAGTEVSDLSPLSKLIVLQELDCYGTKVSDLSPLSDLPALQKLNCGGTLVRDLFPLSDLTTLQELNCNGAKVSDLSPLSGLPALQELDCGGTPIIDLFPLSDLPALQKLNCAGTRVSDLAPLLGIPGLQELVCAGTQVSDLSPLSGLFALQKLSCFETPVRDLSPLFALTALKWVICSRTRIRDLSPLSGLTALQELDCGGTQVSDLSPLSGFTALQRLDCSETDVSDLSPLVGLTALQRLDCSETEVSDLSPLSGLTALQRLNCSSCRLLYFPEELLNIPRLELCLYETRIPGIPVEILSKSRFDDCIYSLRAYLRGLKSGAEEIRDTKLLILGNGRIGKTQICRRLHGEAYDESISSTHGIVVDIASLPQDRDDKPVWLHLWDFGGQDIYHGTHALFMRTRAILMLVWISEAEGNSEYEQDGIIFRNHPLSYWLAYIRHLSGLHNPVLLVQTRCEQPEDEVRHLPVADEALKGFRFCKLLQYSSLKNRGRAALDEALHEAVVWLREQQGTTLIGKGWMRVKQRLEAMRDADSALLPEQRKYRTLSQEHFCQLCAEGKGDIDPADSVYLLEYLHNAGIVFYRKGLFNDQIILDQGWALDAIYSVFHREKSYRQLRYSKGRFYRSLLEALVWQDYSIKEQELFLGMMESCGICFIHQMGDEKLGIEHRYIAPDLLPDKAEVVMELEERWDPRLPTEERVFEYELYQPGLLRSFVSRIGSEARLNALYWKGGVYLYEQTTRSRALVEQEAQDSWRGVIRLQTQKGRAADLLAQLTERLMKEQTQWGVSYYKLIGTLTSFQPSPKSEEASLAESESRPLEFVQEPRAKLEYCVSYAWADKTEEGKERELIVDRLCEAAEARGIRILRDKSALGLGESISRFMEGIGRGDRVFVVLSDKYLKSRNCMFELSEIWRNSRQKGDEFLKRVRTYTLPGTPIFSPLDRAKYAIYWEEELKKLEPYLSVLSEMDLIQYRRMKGFAHNVSDILATIADRLMPRNFDELVQYGF